MGKRSFHIATAITYQNGAIPGTPRIGLSEGRQVVDAKLLPSGYAKVAGRVADRRIILAEYRLADLMKRVTGD